MVSNKLFKEEEEEFGSSKFGMKKMEKEEI